MTTPATLGLDIGGAHIKAAHSDGSCAIAPFAIWEAPEQLTAELEKLVKPLPKFDRIAITTTAELCDCFENKRQGVDHVFTSVEMLAAGAGLKPNAIGAWTTEGELVSLAEARTKPLLCAASNWHAQATWIASQYPIGVTLLIDTGSTTTDIIKLTGGLVNAAGANDTQRLLSGELVYVGAKRTPLMALGPTIDFADSAHPIMNEYFATSADAFLLTDQLSEQPDSTDTCDGRPMTKEYAAARIARMIGADMDMITLEESTQLARSFATTIFQRVAEAIVKVINVPNAPKTSRIVISGSGAFIAQTAARMIYDRTEIILLADQIGLEAAQGACAYALCCLADGV
jgi:hypothetical protein